MTCLPPPSSLPPGSVVDAYVRDSGGPRQEASTDQQLAEIESFCRDHGLLLHHRFADVARSGGSTANRDEFNRMLDLTRRPEDRPAGLLLWNYARFARDLDDAIYYKALLRNRQIVIHSLTDPVPEGQYGRIVEFFIDISNEEKRRQTSTDARRGLRDLVTAHGCVPGVPPKGFIRQPVSLGLRRDGAPRLAHRWVPDPQLVPSILQAFEMRAAGFSLEQINSQLRLFGSINSFATFWPNKLYIGTLEYGDLVIENYCPPIVPPDVWNAVQEIQGHYRGHHHMRSGSANHPRRRNSKYILSGMIRCDRCQSPLFGHSSPQRSGRAIESYFCSRAYRRRDCTKARIPRQIIEDVVLTTLKNYILQPETMQTVKEHLEETQSGSLGEQEQRRHELSSQLASVRKKIGHIISAIADHGKSSALLGRLHELEAEESNLLSRITTLETSALLPIPDTTPGQLETNLQYLLHTFPTEDHETQRSILQLFVERVDVRRDGEILSGVIYYYYPPPIPKVPPPSESGGAVPITLVPPGALRFRHSIPVPFSAPAQKPKKRP